MKLSLNPYLPFIWCLFPRHSRLSVICSLCSFPLYLSVSLSLHILYITFATHIFSRHTYHNMLWSWYVYLCIILLDKYSPSCSFPLSHTNNTYFPSTLNPQLYGRKLTEMINTDHTNNKYLPGIILPDTVVACSDILEVCRDADVLFFVVPHQFLGGTKLYLYHLKLLIYHYLQWYY